MNDTASLLLATTILGICGLGLIMYKSADQETENEHKTHKNEEAEDNFFGLEKFWSSSDDDEDSLQEDVEIYEPKATSKGSKTKRNRKPTGSRRTS